MKTLTPADLRQLRARAHALHPTVSVADKGLSDAVLAEIDRSLKAHELIKVRIYGAERDERAAFLERICEAVDAAPVQHIGNILVLYRERPPEPVKKPAPRPAQKKDAATRRAPAPSALRGRALPRRAPAANPRRRPRSA